MHRMPKTGRFFIGRLAHNDDLLAALAEFCKKRKIKAGVFSLIGAVQNVNLGFYDQRKKVYAAPLAINEELEIVSCTGNISSKDGAIFLHAHIVCANRRGKAFGGHLMPGTRVFAAEFHIQELKGVTLQRTFDRVTGLSLWR